MSDFIKKRYKKETRFQWYGKLALLFSFLFLIFLLGNIFYEGYSAFYQTKIFLSVEKSEKNTRAVLRKALKKEFPNVSKRSDLKELHTLISTYAHTRYKYDEKGVWVIASDDLDMYFKGKVAKENTKLSPKQLAWVEKLKKQDKIGVKFNTTFFAKADSREPEMAGVLGSVVGSIFTILACLAISFPLGVMSAIYLEEFAKKNKFTAFIEVNINNLAAVPSIIYGLLGLALYINIMELPRSAPIVGGLTLAMMVLPIIIISTRTALEAVPNSIRDGARALGASELQVVIHHVLPLSIPGIMTGTILSVARALGETAPLLIIGMVAFIVDVPMSFTDPATAIPVQIYIWTDSPETAFVEKTSAAIMVFLAFLISINALAIFIRSKFEKKW